MNKILYILLFIPFLTQAQYDVFIDGQDSVILNQEVELTINLANAPNVGSFQTRLIWDTLYLDYVNVEINTEIPFMGPSSFADIFADSLGKVTLWWSNEAGLSNDFIDTTWFVKIKLKGIQSGFTNLELYEIEVVDNTGGVEYDHNFTNANMTVYESVGVNDLDADASVSLGAFLPNPTVGSSQIDLDLDRSLTLNYDIYSSIGQKILSKSQYLTKGNHTLYFDNERLTEQGIYFVVFTDGIKTATRKLIIK